MKRKSLIIGLTIIGALSGMLLSEPSVEAMRKADMQALAKEVALPPDSLPRAIENDVWIHHEAHSLINGAHFSEVFPDMIAETSYSVDYDNCAAVIELLVNIIHTQKGLLSEIKNTENHPQTSHVTKRSDIES